MQCAWSMYDNEQTWGKPLHSNLFLKDIHHLRWRSVRKITGLYQATTLQESHPKVNWGPLFTFLCMHGHLFVPPGLISWLRYSGKMSDLVVAVLQLTCSSSRNTPAKPLAVRPGAPGGGIFSQAFSNQLPHTNQVPISYLHKNITCK